MAQIMMLHAGSLPRGSIALPWHGVTLCCLPRRCGNQVVFKVGTNKVPLPSGDGKEPERGRGRGRRRTVGVGVVARGRWSGTVRERVPGTEQLQLRLQL